MEKLKLPNTSHIDILKITGTTYMEIALLNL